jgi:hypothetical protein
MKACIHEYLTAMKQAFTQTPNWDNIFREERDRD